TIVASAAGLVRDLSLLPVALLFIVAVGVTDRIHVRLGSSRPGDEVQWGLSCPVLVAVVLLFPAEWAPLIAALGTGLGCVLKAQKSPHKVMFNVANVAL